MAKSGLSTRKVDDPDASVTWRPPMFKVNALTEGSWRRVHANWVSMSRVVRRPVGPGSESRRVTSATPWLTTTGFTVSRAGTKVRATPASAGWGPSTRACTSAVVSCWPWGMCTTSGTRIRALGSKK